MKIRISSYFAQMTSIHSELFSKVLLKLFEVLDFSRNRGQFENRQFSIAAITEKKFKMMHFEITRIDKRVDIYQRT